MKKFWGIIKQHKILVSIAITFSLVTSLAGVQISPLAHSANPLTQKYVVTIASSVLASGITADYVCDGTADDVQWQGALDSLPVTGGEIDDLTGGNYHFSATVTRNLANVTIRGLGQSSYFSGASPDFTAGNNGWTFENLRVDAGTISMGATTGWLWLNVAVGTTLYTERSPNSSLIDNTFTGNVTGTTVGATALNAPTGRTASYVIAASDATVSWKSQADYVCVTTDVSPAISAGITALGGNGTISISPSVTATFGTTITLPDMSGVNATIVIKGSGFQATNITLSGNNDMFTNTGSYCKVTFQDMHVYGASKAFSFFNGNAYLSTFQNIQFQSFGISAITETKSDASTWILNCKFSSCGVVGTSDSAAILIGNGTSGVHTRDCEFDSCARAWKIKDNSNASSCDIEGCRFGSSAANGNYIEFEYANSIDILNNRIEITTGTVRVLYCPATNSKGIYSVNFQNNSIAALTTLTVPIIDLVRGSRTFQDTNISNNHWDIANQTIVSCIAFESPGQPFSGVNIQNNTVRSDGATVTNGFIDNQTDAPRLIMGTGFGTIANNNANTVLANLNYSGIMTVKGSLTAGNANDITFSWSNPNNNNAQIYILKVTIEVTTPGGTVASVIQVGKANDATGTSIDTSFFTAINANANAINDSWTSGDTGTQTKWVFLQSSEYAYSSGYIVGKILTQNAASLAGNYIIEYITRY